MMNRVLSSVRVRVLLFFVVALSAVITIVSLLLPLNRRNAAIAARGEETVGQAQALALAMEYYDAQRLSTLARSPAANQVFRELSALLSVAKESFGYDKIYLVSQGVGGRLNYLADGDYRENARPMTDYRPIASPYDQDRYPQRCIRLLEEIFEGEQQSSYAPVLLENRLIVSYLPIRGTDGTVVAVLGIDNPLEQVDFAQYGLLNFESLASIFGVMCIVSILLFIISVGAGRENREEQKNRGFKRLGTNKKEKKENNIQVDSLEDIDPSDYYQ